MTKYKLKKEYTRRVQTNIRLTQEELVLWKAAAKSENMTVAKLIRLVMAKHLRSTYDKRTKVQSA